MINEIDKSLRTLLQHRLRTFLSCLGIFLGVASVIAMLSIGEGAKQESLEQIEQLGTHSILLHLPNHAHLHLKEEAHELLNSLLPVKQCAPFKILETTLQGINSKMQVFAITRAYGEIKGFQISEGRILSDLDLKEKRWVCLLGHEVAINLGKKGHVGQNIRLNNIPYEIIGILKSTHWKPSKNENLPLHNHDQSILIPLGTELSLLKSNQDLSTEILFQTHHSSQMELTTHLLRRILEKKENYEGYSIIIPHELLKQVDRTQKTFNLVLGSIAAISLLVGGIGIMNIMIATISERKREIGIRRAVGANKMHIFRQFLLETLLITCIGAVLGVALGIPATALITSLVGWRTIVTSWSIALALFISCFVGLFSGLYPALLAAQMHPIRAIRSQT